MKTAASRKNGAAGYKALVRYADGRTHVPHARNFKTSDETKAYAQKWIDANDALRDYVAANARKDAEFKAAFAAGWRP
jgi:hypothetical protein